MTRLEHNAKWNANRQPDDQVRCHLLANDELSQYDSRCAACYLGHAHTWREHDANLTRKGEGSLASVRSQVYEMAEHAVAAWFRAASLDPSPAYYLYYRQGGREWGAITLATDTPEGYRLAGPERLPRGASREQAIAWVVERAYRLPILRVD